MTVYRLGSSLYPANDGKGAKLYGGRWNHKGIPVIYAAANRALCALEILANSGELAANYVVTQIEIPDDIAMERPSIDSLASNWNSAQHGEETRDIGTTWP